MRFFTAPSALFDALRAQVMANLGQPNIHAEQPWPEGITSLALGEHEYSPPDFAALIEYALANGGSEITEAEYLALNAPPEPEPLPPEPE